MLVLNWLLLFFQVFIVIATTDYGFNSWTTNDIKQFLNSRKIKYKDTLANNDLIQLANSEAKKLESKYKKLKADYQSLVQSPNSLQDYLTFDYLFHNKKPISTWIFESWDVDTLRNFLKQNQIYVSKKMTKPDLIKQIQKKFDKLVEKNQGSQYYPGNWLYSTWTDSDIQNWLNKYQINFDPKASRDQLIDTLSEYSASVSNYLTDSMNSLLDSLDIYDRPIFDTKGLIKDEFFKTWSYSQLREWLYLHDIIDTKPGIYSEDLYSDKLVKLAQTHKLYLLDDLNSWLASAQSKASPFVTKGELGNDSFLAGINKWSKDKLKAFLDARNVQYSMFTTRHQLVELVKNHRNDAIAPENYGGWIILDLSTDSIKEWFAKQGRNIEGTRQELVDAFNEQFQHFKRDNLDTKLKEYQPTLEDYQAYLKEKMPDVTNPEQIEAAYDIATEYFNNAVDAAKEKYANSQYSFDDALKQIKDSLYEYSNAFVEKIPSADDYESFLTKSKIASENFIKFTIPALIEKFDKLESGVGKGINEWWYKVKEVVEEMTQPFNGDEARELVSEALSTIQSGSSDASSVAGKAWKHAKHKHKSAKEFVKDKYPGVTSAVGEAAANAQAKYEDAKGYAKDKYPDVTSVVGEAAANAQDKYESAKGYAKEKYPDVTSVVGEAAANAQGQYEGATSVVGKAAANAKGQYKAASSAVSRAVTDVQGKYEYAEDKLRHAKQGAEQKHFYMKQGYDYATENVRTKYENVKETSHDLKNKYYSSKFHIQHWFYWIKNKLGFIRTDVREQAHDSWRYIVQSFTNNDLVEYLRGYGYDYNWLLGLTRPQLLHLSEAQNKLFIGHNARNKWDKSIGEYLRDTAEEAQIKLGLKKKETFWDKFKSFFMIF